MIWPTMVVLTSFALGVCQDKCDFKSLLDDAEDQGYRWRLTADPDECCLLYPAECYKMGTVSTGVTLWYCRKPPLVS